MDDFDLGPLASDTSLEMLSNKAKEAIELAAEVEKLEALLKGAKSTLHNIRTNQLPALLAATGVAEIVVGNVKLVAKDIVSGSLTQDPEKREKAIQWLVHAGAAGLLKTEVKASFGREQHFEAERAVRMLNEAGIDATAQVSVHSQTLCAFARQRLADGEPLEAELLGLYVGRVVDLKEVKNAR